MPCPNGAVTIERITPSRKTMRLQHYDYSRPGAYFITICSHKKKPIFGVVDKNRTILNSFGMVVKEEWLKTFSLRCYLKNDIYVIMPNHFHALLWITSEGPGAARRAPTNYFGQSSSQSLSSVVRSFKSSVTKSINELINSPGSSVWQRGYYEHVVRKDESLQQIREYIANNPLNWSSDPENPYRL